MLGVKHTETDKKHRMRKTRGKETEARAAYSEVIDFLRSKNQTWYNAESGIADKVGTEHCTAGMQISPL